MAKESPPFLHPADSRPGAGRSSSKARRATRTPVQERGPSQALRRARPQVLCTSEPAQRPEGQHASAWMLEILVMGDTVFFDGGITRLGPEQPCWLHPETRGQVRFTGGPNGGGTCDRGSQFTCCPPTHTCCYPQVWPMRSWGRGVIPEALGMKSRPWGSPAAERLLILGSISKLSVALRN